MSVLYNSNQFNLKAANVSYKKIKMNNLFLNNKFIIYINFNKNYYLKNKILNSNLSSLILNKKYIKSLFDISSFSFLRSNQFLCIFINNDETFIGFVKFLENKQFLYSYKNYLSNIINNHIILEEYNKYNMNFVYVQLILKKIKIKIIILFLFFLISIVKYIE